MSDSDAKRGLIERFWATLYERDFDGVGAFFAADGEYTDMPTPPEDVARGPEQIAARLRLGLEPLESISHTVKTIVVGRPRLSLRYIWRKLPGRLFAWRRKMRCPRPTSAGAIRSRPAHAKF